MFRCKICGKEFPTKEKLGGHASGHSRVGRTRKGIIRIPKLCKNCGNELKRNRGEYCSLECHREYDRTHKYYKGMDITIDELAKYRETHTVCEICGRPETMRINGNPCNLAVDHDHKTNKFRGLLCYSCNTKLSWYENWKDNIVNYLDKNADVV